MNDEQQVRELERQRLDALCRHDVQAVADLMAEDLTHVHATGKHENKAEFVEALELLPRQCERLSLDVRLYGDVAVLTGDIVNSLMRPGSSAPDVVKMRTTQVAHRRDGRWKFVAFHACRN